MSKMVSLGDLRKRDAEADDEDRKGDGRKGNDFFVGGGGDKGSNVAVQAPGKGRGGAGSPGHVADKIIERAAAAGGAGGSSGASSGEPRDGRVSITFYKNGFVVNNGDLRSFEDPANAAFLAAINKGEVPAEIIAERAAGRRRGEEPEIEVNLSDKRTEDYVPPPYRAFGGAGSAVGGGAAAPASAVVSAGSASGAGAIPVDESKPTATIQVKLVDGRKERVVLNLSHTVADLQAKVASFKATTKGFVLLAGFPPKPLADPRATLEAAGLKSAAVTQKEA